MNNYLKNIFSLPYEIRTAENKFQLCDNMQYTRQAKKEKSDRISCPVIARFVPCQHLLPKMLYHLSIEF